MFFDFVSVYMNFFRWERLGKEAFYSSQRDWNWQRQDFNAAVRIAGTFILDAVGL